MYLLKVLSSRKFSLLENHTLKSCNRVPDTPVSPENRKYFSKLPLHSMFNDKLKLNCHFPAVGRNSMTHHQELQKFSDLRQALSHKNNKLNLPTL
jgi:hypothetical protein